MNLKTFVLSLFITASSFGSHPKQVVVIGMVQNPLTPSTVTLQTATGKVVVPRRAIVSPTGMIRPGNQVRAHTSIAELMQFNK